MDSKSKTQDGVSYLRALYLLVNLEGSCSIEVSCGCYRMDLCVKNPTRSNRLTIRAQKPIYSIFGKMALQNLKWPGPSNMTWKWLVRRRQVLHLCTLTMDAKNSNRNGFGPNLTLRAIPLGIMSNMTEIGAQRAISRKWKMVRK